MHDFLPLILAAVEYIAPEYTDQTNLHPVGLAAVVVLGIATLLVPRRHAFVPLIVMACFVSPAQRVAIFQIDFDLLRLLVLAGWVRVLLRQEFKALTWQRIDTVMLLYAASATVTFTILHGSMGALMNRLGMVFDAAGMYFLFRCLIRDWADYEALAKTWAVLALPVAAAFSIEWLTGYNMFSVFGRVPEFTEMRQGRLRCQGPFPHPIIAGCLWAAVAPLIVSLWWDRRVSNVWPVMGGLACLWIVYTTASSTPVGALLAGAFAALLFPLRRQMRPLRWGLLGVLVALHMVMNGPVWSLFAKMDLVGGSTGYHRFNVIDKAINRMPEWWLMGTRSTAHWGWSLFDITNHYVLEGVRGGMLTLLLFCVILGFAYQGAGRAVRAARGHRTLEAMAWGLGVALFVHTTNFFGVSYFGQISIAWYSTLAAAGSLGAWAVAYEKQRRAAALAASRASSAGDEPDAEVHADVADADAEPHEAPAPEAPPGGAASPA